MKIRKIEKNEVGFLGSMLYEAIFVPHGKPAPPKDIIRKQSLSKYIDNWYKDQYDIALVAEVKNQLIGAIWGRLFDNENKGYGFIDNHTPELVMAIRSEFRNKGIGTNLLTSLFSEYQKIGVDQLSLSVDKANGAIRLYEKMDFKIVEEQGTSWTMKKQLVPSKK